MIKYLKWVKNFRNEGMDRTHNPEFTAIEIYKANADLDYMIELVESIFQITMVYAEKSYKKYAPKY